MKISLIAAIDQKNGLGFKNKLLCHLPADLQHFKKLTLNKPIIMGRKTFYSIGKALPNRRNVVLSKHAINSQDIERYCSFEQALESFHENEVMIIGGAQLYNYALSYASCLYITEIHHQFLADTFFPKIELEQWSCIDEKFYAKDEKNHYDMTFKIYQRIIS